MRVLATIVLILAGCSSVPVPTASTDAPASLQPTAEQNSTPRAAPRAVFGDGTHRVPDDVAPGTYRTVGDTEQCYWVRLAGFEDGLEDWISSRIGPGYQVVTIAPDDAGFDSIECGGWTDELAPVTESTRHFGEGTYIVGTDLEPGTWTAELGDNCYWARLSGFGGTEAETVDDDLANNGLAPVVAIAASDAGFTSNGCGDWRIADP